MNRGIRIFLFIIIATFANLFFMGLYFILSLSLFLVIRNQFSFLGGVVDGIIVPILILLSIIGSFFTYSRLFKWANARWNIELNLQKNN